MENPKEEMINEDVLDAHPHSGYRSGFVSLLGCPNVGKSTLLNRLLGTKLAIVSQKPQTTRHRILGVRTDPNCQYIFLDTPGIHQPKEKINRFMVEQAYGAIADADICVALIECARKKDNKVQIHRSVGQGDLFVLEKIREAGVPYIAVLNKIDLIQPEALLKSWEEFHKHTPDALQRIAISAFHDSGVTDLLKLIHDQLPEGPMLYPKDTVTDRTQKFILSELIREKIFESTHEELPYASAVLIESSQEREKDGVLIISALVAVENSSQKKIMIGKNGEMLKRIGTAARKEIEQHLGKHVYLEIKVEMVRDWRRRENTLERFGYVHEE